MPSLLCIRITLLGGLTIPLFGLGSILWNTNAISLHPAKNVLRIPITLLGGPYWCHEIQVANSRIPELVAVHQNTVDIAQILHLIGIVSIRAAYPDHPALFLTIIPKLK